MIKVNLLDSVTDRAKGVAAVEEKVANPHNQTMLMALVIFGLLAAGMFYDYHSSVSAREEQQKDKAVQEQVQAQMVAVNKERADLEKKTNDIQARINAIQNLRALCRSEEHTSELQSRQYLVCRLLLEKKNKKNV